MEKEAAELEAQLSGGTADSSTLRRAAGAYAALGDSAKAGAALEKLTAQDPSDLAAWQALVSLDWPVSELYILGTMVSRIARKHNQYEVHFRLQIEGEGRLRNASLPLCLGGFKCWQRCSMFIAGSGVFLARHCLDSM